MIYIKTFQKSETGGRVHVVETQKGIRVMVEFVNGLSEFPVLIGKTIYYDHIPPKYLKELAARAFDYIKKGVVYPVRCDSCSPSTIQGVFCHERGCPNDYKSFNSAEGLWEDEFRGDE